MDQEKHLLANIIKKSIDICVDDLNQVQTG